MNSTDKQVVRGNRDEGGREDGGDEQDRESGTELDSDREAESGSETRSGRESEPRSGRESGNLPERESDAGFSEPARILETIDDGVYTLDENFVITSVNGAVAAMTGYDREELVGTHASLLAGDETLSMAHELIGSLRNEGGDVGRIDTTIQSAEGEPIPVETRFSTIQLSDGATRQVGVLRDVGDRRRYEEMLTALNRTSRRFLEAETAATVYECAAEAAASVLPSARLVAYRYDETGPALEPVAHENADPTPVGPGTEPWEAFASAAERGGSERDGIVDAAASFDRLGEDIGIEGPSGRVLERKRTGRSAETPADGPDAEGGAESGEDDRGTVYATLDEYGLLAIEAPSVDWSADVTEFVELLAANAVAALERVEREAQLARGREALEKREERLAKLHEYNDLLRRINDALVDAETVEGVASEICEHLTRADPVAFAWIAEADRDGTLRPLASAGREDGYLAALGSVDAESAGGRSGPGGEKPTPLDHEPPEPTARAIVEEEPVVVSAIAEGLRDAAWRGRALSRGYQSVISVPVAYNDLRYGVLSVYADRGEAFDGSFGEMLAELGTTAGNAINGIETKRSLRRGATTEIDLRVTDADDPLARIAATLDETVRFDGVVPDLDGGSLLYLTTDTEPEELADVIPAVRRVRVLGGAPGAHSVEVQFDDGTASVVELLADFGATIEAATADAEAVDVTVRLPNETDVRSVVEAIERDGRTVDLRGRRERDDAPRTPPEFLGALKARLTDRQFEAVRTAYLSGYFEWPRASTGEEVADALDITQPTFNRHLRTAERKLFDLLFDSGGESSG